MKGAKKKMRNLPRPQSKRALHPLMGKRPVALGLTRRTPPTALGSSRDLPIQAILQGKKQHQRCEKRSQFGHDVAGYNTWEKRTPSQRWWATRGGLGAWHTPNLTSEIQIHGGKMGMRGARMRFNSYGRGHRYQSRPIDGK